MVGERDTVEDLDFDMVAASLRADAGDMRSFTRVLAAKLEDALPQQTQVERKSGGLFSREKTIQSVTVDLGDERYMLVATRGTAETRRLRVVRGIVLKAEVVPLEEWIDALSAALAQEARSSERARLSLERMLSQ